MTGRADKGIIITTGTFTAEARREASRDGAPPLELIDGEKLIDQLENLRLGLTPVNTFEVEGKFFNDFGLSSENNNSHKPTPKGVSNAAKKDQTQTK